METKICKHCATQIPKDAKICPNCRKRVKGLGAWGVIGIIVGVLILIGVLIGGTSNSTSTGSAQIASTEVVATTIYEDENVLIQSKGLDGNHGVKLYIENKTDTTYTIQTRETSVNGYGIDFIMSDEIPGKKKVNTTMDFWFADLEENDIKTIEEIEFKFHIFDDSWINSYDTPTIILTF